MEFLLVEAILWAGLIFFFWALKENLGRVESDIETIALAESRERKLLLRQGYIEPDTMLDPIGTYKERPIYRYAFIHGKRFQYDHILLPGCKPFQASGACCIAPGLVYVECRE